MERVFADEINIETFEKAYFSATSNQLETWIDQKDQ